MPLCWRCRPGPAVSLLPARLSAPAKFRAIVNAHFRYDLSAHLPPFKGIVEGSKNEAVRLPTAAFV